MGGSEKWYESQWKCVVAGILTGFCYFKRIRNTFIRTDLVDETGIKQLKTIKATQHITCAALLLFHFPERNSDFDHMAFDFC